MTVPAELRRPRGDYRLHILVHQFLRIGEPVHGSALVYETPGATGHVFRVANVQCLSEGCGLEDPEVDFGPQSMQH